MGAFIRRHKTPKTQSERMTETAALRKACPVRLQVLSMALRRTLPRDFVLRCQSQPGTEVFFVGKFRHIRAGLHDDFLSQHFAQAVNGGHVHAADTLEMLADGANGLPV